MYMEPVTNPRSRAPSTLVALCVGIRYLSMSVVQHVYGNTIIIRVYEVYLDVGT